MKGSDTLLAALAYALLAILLTWPLALGLGSDVPGDLGDSVLVMWILSWGADHLPGLLTGAVSWQGYWNANIFHPEPLALALSEHLFGQTLQILPLYWLTGNILLCYNLIFLSTFALSGFGTYLLVRDLTGDRRAAFVAGLVFGFLPYRISAIPHVQVMSAQWMPFALYGLNRFVTTRSRLALVGGTSALVMQNWSCGYYLLYFTPLVPLFTVHRMWAAGRLRDARVWMGLAGAGAVTAAASLPFLLPYLEVQQRFGFERPLGEVVVFSANVWSYITAPEALWVWGRALRFYPHGEGETFLGFTSWLLAGIALAYAVRSAMRETTLAIPWAGSSPQIGRREVCSNDLLRRPRPWDRQGRFPIAYRMLEIGLLLVVFTQVIAVVTAVIFGGFDGHVFGLPLRARTPVRLITQLLVVSALLIAVSPRVRSVTARLVRSPVVFVAGATLLAMWLSLGPAPAAGDHQVSGIGLYGVLYDYVPGFDGVRVPARYAMVAGLFLAVLAGYGTAAFGRWRHGAAWAALAGVLVLAESAAIPLQVNASWAQYEAMPPARVFPAQHAPPVYARIAALPAGTVVTEFPFGDAGWELRYAYYSAAHWKPLTNGYSGSFPPSYMARVARWRDVSADPEAAWQALVDSGTTHVVLHAQAFAKPADAALVRDWLANHGASLVASFPDGDVLYAVRP